MTGFNALPRDHLQRLTREFSGELILWAGQPSPRIVFIRSMLIWLFAIPWTVFALAWVGIALGAFFAEGPWDQLEGAAKLLVWVFPLFGVPFVVIGVWLMARPLLEARKARRTVHVLTETRLVTAEMGETITLTSLVPSRIVEVTRRDGPAGTGTLSLALAQGITNDDETRRVVHLIGVPDVAELDRELRRLMQAR